jgi:hypothetical protein
VSYKEKRTIVSMITGALVLMAYCVYAYGQYQSGFASSSDLRFWAGAILRYIGIGVLAGIVVQIAFHILISISIAVAKKCRDETVDDKDIERTIELEMTTDEMDSLIELKSMRVGFIIAGIGFVGGLASLVLGMSPAFMLNTMFICFSAGSLLDGVTQIYFYRRGIRHG